MRLKRLALAALGLSIATASLAGGARAETFFEAEVGLGAQHTSDMGDGIWVQYGLPHAEHLTTPAVLAGLTGPIWSNGPWSVRWHLDYVYMGQLSVTSLAVPDNAYNTSTHRVIDTLASKALFVSGGHTQGVSASLESGLEWEGWRLTAEAGPWIYWPSWSVSVYDSSGAYITGVRHPPHAQVDWMAGAGVERGNVSLRYRYYHERPYWGGLYNGQQIPAIGTGTHMVYLGWRF